MTRFAPVSLLAALMTLFAATPLQAKPKEVIVLLLIDATRPDHLGCYGYDKPTSPHIDALAARGTRFTRIYSNAPWTRPSTTSFLTGINASRHTNETEDSKLPENVVTLAQRMRDAGYTTAGFVANGNGGSLANLDKDFHVFHDTTNTYKPSVRGKTYNGLPTAPFIADKALAWLDKTDAEKVFVFLFFVDPHDPYGAPERLEKIFLGDYKGKIRRKALWEYHNDYPENERFSMQAVYNGGIRHADEAVGAVVEGLKDQGLIDVTTMFVSADHGEGFGEHGFYLHAHHFWDEVVHIPLVAVGPKFKTGVDERLGESLDVTRTIAELGGANTEGLIGHSLLAPAEADKVVISEYNEFGIHRQMIRGPRYKVIWQRPADWEWYKRTARKKEYFPSVNFEHEVIHVFDMQEDAAEKKDLSKEMPAPAAALLTRLRTFVKGTKAADAHPSASANP